jgi:hypothetical protein
MNFTTFSKVLDKIKIGNNLTLDMLGTPGCLPNYATHNADLQDPLPGWAHLSYTQRETERGRRRSSSSDAEENRGRQWGGTGRGPVVAGDGGGWVGQLHSYTARPHALVAWTAVVGRGEG